MAVLSVIVPAYNEQATIANILDNIFDVILIQETEIQVVVADVQVAGEAVAVGVEIE